MDRETKQFRRAVSDLEAKIRNLLAEQRPIMQAKYGLSDYTADVATTRAMGIVTVDCARVADISLEPAEV